MNIALSPAHGTYAAGPSLAPGRHPVGLAAVVGLHVVVAVALLTARMMHTPPAADPGVTLLPDPPKPPQVHHVDDVQPPPLRPRTIYVEPPLVPVEPPPEQVKDVTPDKPVKPSVETNTHHEEQQVASAESTRFKPRAGHLDANAAGCHPDYPAAAQRAGATGVSRIRFTISASGQVIDARILQPSGPTREHRLLDQAAAAALAQCPVTVGSDESGHAAASTADVEYVWSLN